MKHYKLTFNLRRVQQKDIHLMINICVYTYVYEYANDLHIYIKCFNPRSIFRTMYRKKRVNLKIVIVKIQ